MKKILLVSDSHGKLTNLREVLTRVKPVDMVLHMGDVGGEEIGGTTGTREAAGTDGTTAENGTGAEGNVTENGTAAEEAANTTGEGILGIFSGLTENISNIPENINENINTLTESINSVPENVKTVVNRFIEALAVMLVTSCVIPVIVLLFFIWLIKIVLEVNLNLDLPKFHRRERPGTE